MKQLPLSLQSAPACTLDDFVPGTNAQLLAHLQAVGTAQRLPTMPVSYLWGVTGSGKSHLLQGFAQLLRSHGALVVQLAQMQDMDELVALTGSQRGALILDDCDSLSAAQQHLAFRAFVQATSLGLAVLAAGRQPPVDLPLRDDLRSRLGWGLTFQVHALSDELRVEVLRRDALRRGVVLSEEVQAFLMTRFDRDLKSLISLMDRLDEFSLAQKRTITVPLLKTMLAQEFA